MLTGQYLIEVQWLPRHRARVQKFGDVYVMDYPDQVGRRRFFEGQELAFGVTIFKERAPLSIARFIVKGDFDSVIYVDSYGNRHTAAFKKIEIDQDDTEQRQL